MGRQDRRIQLKRSVAEVSRHGMNLTASGSDQSWFVIAATRILLDILEGRSTSRARNAARRAHEFFETSLKANPSKHKIDCAQGCNFCCHVSVVATAPEIFLVANAIREQHKDDFEAVLQRVKEADEKTRGISSMQRAQRRIPCALLGSDGLCTVYTSRPGACRGFTSTSKLACQRGFNGEDVAVSTPQVWTSLRSAHKQALWAALAAAKLPVENYEYHHALRVALETPDAEARWLNGEDIFGAVARETTTDPVASAHNTRIINMLVAGATGKDPT